jgi:hypothetical protein
MRTVLIDTSSAILLFKVGLTGWLVRLYPTAVMPSVFSELTRSGYDGAEYFSILCRRQQIQVVKPCFEKSGQDGHHDEMPALNPGERDTIRQFKAGFGRFIIIDDGKAARYCMKQGLPFINALLFPKVLVHCGRLSASDCTRRFQQLVRCGRYSSKIIELAERCPTNTLQQFSP